MGAFEAAKTILLSEKADPMLVVKRIQSCTECKIIGSDGKPLYRDSSVVGMTCGYFSIVEAAKGTRDEKKDGCGCILSIKWDLLDAKCPHGRW